MRFHIFHKWGRWVQLFTDDPYSLKRSCEKCGLVRHKRIKGSA